MNILFLFYGKAVKRVSCSYYACSEEKYNADEINKKKHKKIYGRL